MAKSLLAKVICKVLGKSLPYVCNKDSRAFETFVSLPKNLKISLGIFGEGRFLSLMKTENQIIPFKAKSDNEFDLQIEFKNRKSAKLVLLGKISVAESFARHDILLKGNINTAVALVNIIDLCEYYLFPRFITYKFLPRTKKQFCSLALYFFVLFGSAKNIKISEPKLKEHKKDVKKSSIKNENVKKDKNAKHKDSEAVLPENLKTDNKNNEVDRVEAEAKLNGKEIGELEKTDLVNEEHEELGNEATLIHNESAELEKVCSGNEENETVDKEDLNGINANEEV